MFPELNEGSMNGSNESGTRKQIKGNKCFVFYSTIDADFKMQKNEVQKFIKRLKF
jgi:hypothetical protein